MKLLFDENLSPKLPALLRGNFPDCQHLRDCGLKGATDEAIWEYARMNGYTVVSKDADFYQRSLFYGSPPQFIWLRLGNCSRSDLVMLLISNEARIRAFAADPLEAVLILF